MEAALLFDDKKYPPLLPRKLRVTRAKSLKKNSANSTFRRKPLRAPATVAANSGYRPKASAEVKTLQGRASKLLGHAAAAKVAAQNQDISTHSNSVGSAKRPPESFVFEGHRASNKEPPKPLATKGSGNRHGKPRTRSSKRGAAFKAAGRRNHGV